MLGLLVVIGLSLWLVKRQQDLRRGAAGLKNALLILSPESVGATIGDNFDINFSVSTEATMSAVKLNVCYPNIVDLEQQTTELEFFDLYVNAVGESGGEKCVEIVLTGITSDDKLPSKFFKLLKLNFVAKQTGRGVVKIDTAKSQMVGVGGEIAFDSGINEVVVSVNDENGQGGGGGMKYWKCDPVTKICEEIGQDECEQLDENCLVNENCPIDYSCVGTTITPTLSPETMKYWLCDETNKTCEEISETTCNLLGSDCKKSADCPEGYVCSEITITPIETIITGTPITIACQDCKTLNSDYVGNGRHGGDYNCDGTVNGSDFIVWRREALDKIMKYNCWQADGSGDDKVSLQDYSLWRERYLIKN